MSAQPKNRTRLEWLPNDTTTDGRFSIYSEHPRGEPRYYWLECADPSCARVKNSMGLAADGSFDKRKVKRLAQRIADAIATGNSAMSTPHLEPRPSGVPEVDARARSIAKARTAHRGRCDRGAAGTPDRHAER
jgi:hypothetical protein